VLVACIDSRPRPASTTARLTRSRAASAMRRLA
jgi:hypothetical protein